ncbi:prostaglandin reductase-3 isoform X2 [Hydra vulgaris]|uniref:Prostaglandin reductase-3 isoform X2 n=1 Tax=Hydra vulgaris TaxID=6087 RepID=A0ABM4BFT3_HYDVU
MKMASRTFRKVIATSLTTDFRKACEIITTNFKDLKPNEVLVKSCYTGINATDINVTAGRYGINKVPFDVGLEGLGMIEGVGSGIPQNMIGQSVGYIFTGSFAEYVILPAKYCLPLPSVKPEYIPLLISGLTASIAFEQFGHLKPKENVLITAAAGGTGHIAVQLAKQAGCHVIGTCSSKSKVDLLKKLGCDHVINYKEENLFEILKRDYPSGIDVVYESIGGDIFDACLNRLAVNGRMIVLGYINSYHSPAGIDRSQKNNTLVTKLLLKSGSVCGFFLMNHMKQYPAHLAKLVQMVDDGRLKVLIEHCDDNGHQFKGLETVFKGVDYLYSQRSKGKIVIDLKNGSSKL